MSGRKFMPKLLVVKFGTSNLSSVLSNKRNLLDELEKSLDPQIFLDYARQITELCWRGVKVVIVTSGAIRAGKEIVEDLARRASDFHKKELAAIGMRRLLNLWGSAFENSGMEIAQILVTHGNWQNQGEQESIKASILNLLEQGVIPVIDENDIVSDREIKLMEERISENDRLAAGIASLIGADAVLFLTDQEGVYEDNPETNPKAKLYDEINVRGMRVDLENLIANYDGVSESGTGGMGAKLKAAIFCAEQGMEVAIAGNEPDVIVKFAKGESVGTRIGLKADTRFKVC